MKKRQNVILLPGQEEVFSLEEEDGVIDSKNITRGLLVILVVKNLGDLVVIFIEFLKNIF